MYHYLKTINSNIGPRADREQQPQQLRKKPPVTAPVALRILGALDPSNVPVKPGSEERFMAVSSYSDSGHREREKDPPERKEKRGFWSYLTATASEDWGLVLEVTERVSASENNAKEAARALRREFKYGEPTAQLAAARLWAILLRNAKNEVFIYQSTSRKFTETLEDLLSSARTSPVVRERVLDVIAAAAYASGKTTGFRTLWKRVKPADKPDEGMPLDNDDAMFNPPVSGRPQYDNHIPQTAYQEPPPLTADYPPTPTPQNIPTPRKKTSESRNRIIPPDEDIRRLFQECKIGQGNASLLSQALALSKPEDLKKKDVIKEFYLKCRSSQELIFAQISWASAEAERSRVARDQEALMNGHPEEQRLEQTTQEKLLASLLSANAELMDSLQQYDDLERVAIERKTEEVSRKETKMDRRQLQQYQQDEFLVDPAYAAGGTGTGGSPPTRSRTPSPMRTVPTQQYHHSHSLSHSETGGLAPPPPAPHGPRSPAHGNNNNAYAYNLSRTPSPVLDPGYEALQNGMTGLRLRGEGGAMPSVVRSSIYDEDVPVKPSAKALGKQRVVEDDAPEHFGEEDFYEGREETYSVDERIESDDDKSTHEGWPHHRPTQFVYDAAAERTQQRIREGHLLVNGVH
ncbi:hypothetical protein DXG01_003641 [Tephrocybe rancida]|nr:hypothetical protein DXG01_003641 [Tephrocybe rancida]